MHPTLRPLPVGSSYQALSHCDNHFATVQMGNAVQAACENLIQELIRAAVGAKGGKPEDWRVMDGKLWRGEQPFSFADIVRAYQGIGHV